MRGLAIVADVVGIVMGMIGLWELAARFDWVPGPSPIERAQEVLWSQTPSISFPPLPDFPTIEPDGPDELAAPQGLQATGDCGGMRLTWQPVDGAERYTVERDGQPLGFTSTAEPEYQFTPFPDGDTHAYRVRARAFGVTSPASSEVMLGPCSL